MKANPAEGVGKTKLEGDGFPAWQIEDMRAFCIKWEIGTRQRLAMELAMHTGLRRTDLVRIGRQHMRGTPYLFPPIRLARESPSSCLRE